MDEGEQPWEDPYYWWHERPGAGEPIALELVWNMKSWEVIADKGKETLHIRGFLIFYWTDARLRGYPTKEKGDKPPEKIWRPTFITCAGFSLERGEKGGLLPEFYSAGVDKELFGATRNERGWSGTVRIGYGAAGPEECDGKHAVDSYLAERWGSTMGGRHVEPEREGGFLVLERRPGCHDGPAGFGLFEEPGFGRPSTGG